MADIRVIYPKDIARILRKSESAASRLLKVIKDAYSKKDHQLVTVSEFASYTGLNESDLSKEIK